MAVGGVKGGGRKGGAGGAKGASGAGKASGAGFAGKVDRLEGAMGSVATSGPAPASATDPLTARAMEIARQLKSGQIKTKEEATKRLVADILKEKVRMQSKALTKKISDTLQDDPRLGQALERLWAKAE